MNELLAGTPLAVIPDATLTALIAGALLPLLGLWVVLQRVVFLGITLAQVAAAGVALGLLVGWPPLPLGFLLCLLMVGTFTRRTQGVSAGGDSTLGAAFCAASALALLFISRSPAEMDQVEHVLHGNLIFASPTETASTGLALLAGVAVTLLFFRPMLFAAFDPEAAAALGLHPRRWTLLLFAALAVVLTFSMRTTGALLTFALLILPPLAALQMRRGLVGTFVLASGLGVLGTLAGLLVSVTADLHLESSIVVTSFLLLPIGAAWRLSPLLSVALVAGLGLLAPRLAPDTPLGPGGAHAHGAGAPAAVPKHEPWHVDVHLDAVREDGGRVAVRWTADLHREDPDAPLPPALWLIVSGGGRTAEHALVSDAGALAPGDHDLSGRLLLEDAAAITHLDGQVWTGPTSSFDALPVDASTVIGCDVR